MNVSKISTVEISVLANKQKTYLREHVFSLAKEHKVRGEFGEYFIDLHNPSEELIKSLKDAKIKFDVFG